MCKKYNQTEHAIKYIVSRLSGRIVKTQLLKFIYLSDLELRKLTGRPISDLDYIWWNNGPYDKSFNRSLEHLRDTGFIIEESRRRALDEKNYFLYHNGPEAIEEHLSNMEKEVIDKVVEAYFHLELPALLEDVVYETRPMLKAIKEKAFGERLDVEIVDYEYQQDLNRINLECVDFELASAFLPNVA